MLHTLIARLKIAFWSIYGRFIWDEQTTTPHQVQQVTAILAAKANSKAQRVLDLGCGMLESHHFAVLSLDSEPPILAVALKLHAVALMDSSEQQ